MPEPPRTPLILDTHVWIFAVEGMQEELGSEMISQIEAAARSGSLLVSAISVWELAMLVSDGRLILSQSVDDWARRALNAPGTHLLPLTPEIAIESTRLPGALHADPADRMLVAGARITGGRLATKDRALLSYSRHGHVNAVDAAA
jgi:PIN domain nuclease of toxin-antitoxin system